MKKVTKSIITSSLLALAFGAMSVGTTFALFTSKAETTINVESGVIDLKAPISVVSAWELGGTSMVGSDFSYQNSIGGSITKDENNIVHLNKLAPGDGAIFALTPNNSGTNIKTKARLVVTLEGDLADALNVEVKAGKNKVIGFKGAHTGYTPWEDVLVGKNPTAFNVKVEFPNGDNGEILFGEDNHDNQYQNKTATLVISYQAVQGNAQADDVLQLINTKLMNEAYTNGKNETMYDALQDLSASQVAAIQERGYVWSVEEDQFYVSAAPAQAYKYFKMYAEMPDAQTYSIYASGTGWTTVELTGVGFDAGSVSGITSVSYVGASDARTNIIRTNTAQTTLTINAPLDTIHHYDALGALNIIEAATASYHEFGSIAYAEIAKGRIVLEEGSAIEEIHINKKADEQAFDTVIIANNGGAAELPEKITRDAVTVSEETLVVKVESNGTSENVYVYADGVTGTKGSTEKVTEGENKQNENVNTPLGQLVLDNGSEPGEKAQTTEEKEEAKAENVNKAVYQEKIDAVSTKWTGETVELVKVTRDWMKIKNNLLYYVLPSDTVYGSGFGENRPADSEEEFNEYYDNAVSFATMVETTLSGKFYLDTNEKTIHVCGADCLQYLYLLDDYLSAKNQIACKETKYPFGVFYNAEVRWVIKVDNDIDLGGKIENDNIINNWTPVNSQLAVDFQGHKVTNLVTDRYIVEDGSIASTSGASGLFGFTRGQIKNLVLENVTIFNLSASKESCAGAIAGNIASGIFNCKVINANIISSKWVGGIAGIGYGSIENCTIENSTITAGYKIGGLIGQSSTTGNGTAGPSIDFKNNTLKNVTIQINKEIAGKTGYDVGKLVGYLQNNSTITGNTLTNVSIKVSSESGYVDLTEDIEIHKGHNGSTMLYDENGLVGIYEASFTVTF